MMSQINKWKYYAARCSFKETKKSDILGRHREGYWILQLDKEFSLADGPNHMGELGYELVGIQIADMFNNGTGVGWYTPSSFYIFKKPLEPSTDNI